MAEREQELHEKLEFLQEQLKEAVARAEEAERKVQPQETIIDDLTQEHDSYAEKIRLIKQELKDMEDEVERSMDDVEAVEQKKVTDRYQEHFESEEPKSEPDPVPDAADEDVQQEEHHESEPEED